MNRLEFAQKLLQQPVPTCPFLDAVDTQTRDTLLEQHPDPHTLPEAQLLELAKQHGYNSATPHQVPLNEGEAPQREQPVRCCLVSKKAQGELHHANHNAHLETDFLALDFTQPRPTGRPQGSPLQKHTKLEGKP
jgi:hypothetical protein